MNPVLVKLLEQKKSVSNFTAAKQSGEGLVMYKALMSLSNLHETIADMFELKGDKSKAAWHQQMSDKIRTEANQEKNKE